MSNEKSLIANLTIDLKRNRFRIFRKTMRYLGNPPFIQFLINPEELYIAILGSDRPIPGGTANRINLNMDLKSCVEFYSTNLMDGLFKIFGRLDYGCSYHLSGEIDQTNRVAYFSLSTLKKVERKL
ncbi:hypothetical protein LJC56_11165 [Christensenellaceae bacterium OttesenSCG-928-K19]|nr:hypothetical protein [Christensenellaceae bacterium OttesenSCG-928-K19]